MLARSLVQENNIEARETRADEKKWVPYIHTQTGREREYSRRGGYGGILTDSQHQSRTNVLLCCFASSSQLSERRVYKYTRGVHRQRRTRGGGEAAASRSSCHNRRARPGLYGLVVCIWSGSTRKTNAALARSSVIFLNAAEEDCCCTEIEREELREVDS